jgi:hypothetical protein
VEELLAYVGAELKKPEDEISDELVALINARIKPPKPVTKEDIFVRTMYLVSDEINSYGGCFPLGELHNLTNLVIDSPVMIGHTKEKLPIARNFKSEVVQKEGKNWVKVWFYWLKNSKDAFSLKENIDHGIYKECSLGFVFEFPECSICGEDMRKCRHVPFKTYPDIQEQEDRGQEPGARVQGSEFRSQRQDVGVKGQESRGKEQEDLAGEDENAGSKVQEFSAIDARLPSVGQGSAFGGKGSINQEQGTRVKGPGARKQGPGARVQESGAGKQEPGTSVQGTEFRGWGPDRTGCVLLLSKRDPGIGDLVGLPGGSA